MTADDLNAEFTANQWLRQDLTPIAELIDATFGMDGQAADHILHTWRDFGPDYVAARAAVDLETL